MFGDKRERAPVESHSILWMQAAAGPAHASEAENHEPHNVKEVTDLRIGQLAW